MTKRENAGVGIGKAKKDNRPKRGGWAPGDYYSLCQGCNETFIGDKRARSCADCAYDSPTECAGD